MQRNRMYTLVKVPSGTLYSKLIFYSLKHCKTFLLVLRPTVAIKTSAQNTLNDLKPYCIEKNVQSEWPGTKLLSGEAIVYYFELNEESAEYILSVSDSVFAWLHPDLPEDLCLLREDGNPWLVTISHERDAYLFLSDEEKENLILEIPELLLKENLNN